MCLPNSSSGYIPLLKYHRTSRIDYLIFCGAILTLLESPSKTFLTLIAAFTALPTVISLLLLFLMGRVTRHLLKIQLLVTYQPVLLQLSEVLSCTIRWNNMRNKQWGVSATAFLNNLFLCSISV